MAAALVYPQGVIVVTERPKLVLQIRSIPIERMIQTFLPKGSDEPFDERMRNRDIQHGRDRFDTEDPQVGLPAVEVTEGIVVEPEPKALALTRDSLLKSLHKAGASTVTRCTPKPMSRRLNWSTGINTQ
jgi:hypothetical protein